MASSINASTSGAGGVITTADNTGTLQLQSGGTTIATISSTGITTQVGAPAFSAYQSSAQTLSSGASTKITFTTEAFDTNNNFASSAFTPTVAGYYQLNCGITNGSATVMILMIYKNGSLFYRIQNTNPSTVATLSGSNLMYLNGSTDYVEVYAYLVTGSTLQAFQADTYFSGFLARSA
jgi:hypothetical protein